MEHGSIITQARREDALVLTKQGRGATSQNFASPPGRGEAGESGGTRGQPAPAHPSALRPPWGGSSEARAASAQREGVIRAAVTRRATPPPRGRAARQATRAAPTRAAALEWSLFFSPHRGASVRPGGRVEGTGWGGPELERRRRLSSHAGPRTRATGAVGRGGAWGLGAKFTGPRRGRRWGRGRAAATAGRGTRAIRRSPRARPEARPEPLPARCTPPGPPLYANTEPRLFSPGAVSVVT